MSSPPTAPAQPVQRVLHVLNYGWPYIDGYTVRSIGLITAQQRYLGLDVTVATSPFMPLTAAMDRGFETSAWHPGAQIRAARHHDHPRPGSGLRTFERPGLGLAPATRREFQTELTSVVRRLTPDLIHVHHPHYIGAVAIDVARAFDLPCVYELRCFNGDYDLGQTSRYAHWRGRVFNRREAAACRAADAVVTISQGLADRIAGCGVEPANIFVVRNSVNAERFQQPAASAQTRRQRVRIGYACTFSPMEGLDLLVDAIALLPAATRAGIEVVLAGDGADRARIEARIAERGVGDTVHLPGFIAYGEMPAFYAALDLFVVPRRDSPVAVATTPLKPLEARAAGVPLLVSDLPALRELLGENAADARFTAPEPAAMSQALTEFLNRPWAGATQTTPDRSWANEVERYRAVYTRAVERARRIPAQPARLRRIDTQLRRAARRGVRKAVDAGLPGTTPLARHVVVCGFPRTGSTLLQLMIGAGVPDVRVFDGEIEALWAARYALRHQRWMLTKNPRDIDQIETIRAFYAGRSASPHFVIMLRDPRAVLTSTHAGYPDSHGYYVDFARWRHIHARYRALHTAADVTCIRYEDLVRAPNNVQARLEAVIGWGRQHDFADYDQPRSRRPRGRDSMTEGALGGFRPVESSRVDQWRDPVHTDRLRAMLEAIPDMPAHLIEMGYENDARWCDELV